MSTQYWPYIICKYVILNRSFDMTVQSDIAIGKQTIFDMAKADYITCIVKDH